MESEITLIVVSLSCDHDQQHKSLDLEIPAERAMKNLIDDLVHALGMPDSFLYSVEAAGIRYIHPDECLAQLNLWDGTHILLHQHHPELRMDNNQGNRKLAMTVSYAY